MGRREGRLVKERPDDRNVPRGVRRLDYASRFRQCSVSHGWTCPVAALSAMRRPDAWVSDGPTWTDSTADTSRNLTSKGNRRNLDESFPSIKIGDCVINSAIVRPLSCPSDTRLGLSSRSLSSHASLIGPSRAMAVGASVPDVYYPMGGTEKWVRTVIDRLVVQPL